MDKSYIIRIYKQEKESVSGIVENVEENKRDGFSNANELWSLITRTTQEYKTSNLIKFETSKTTTNSSRTSKTY